MRKLGTLLVVLLGLLVVAVGVMVFASNRMLSATVTVPVEPQPITVRDGDPVAIERGQYLVDHVLNCKVCHAPDFGGRAEVDNAMIGTLWGPNLTSGAGSATVNYTPTDWARSIQHGVDPTGRRLILMPSEDFHAFSSDDIGAVVAYIKSMPVVDREDQGIKVGPLGRALLLAGQVTFAFDKIDHTAGRPSATPSNTADWGEVMVGTCRGCHGETLSGGPIPGGDPSWPPARNLTPDATGLKEWTGEDFTRLLREGKRPDGTQVANVMPWRAYSGMTDSDIQAIWAYLSTRVPAKAFGGR